MPKCSLWSTNKRLPSGRKAALAVLLLGALGSCEIRSDDAFENAAHVEPACEPVVFEETPLTLCIAEPGRHAIRVDLAPPDEEAPYRSLVAFAQSLDGDSGRVVFAMNGGMFDGDGNPIGYYVEDGRRLGMLNRNEGPGNFHMLPNGVFFGSAEVGWRVMTADDFAAEIEDRPQFATQSGPMLVVDGEVHPDFESDGTSRKIRNAVGVDQAGRALFVISEAPLSFGKLARFYRDVLRADNALFLDGTVSQLWDPSHTRLDTGAPIGPLIVVENRAEAAQ